ncbi:MAG: hypothetical protein WA211_01295 [Candidatus Acidiferrales bacterium]
MNSQKYLWQSLLALACGLFLISHSHTASAQQNSEAATTSTPQAAARDGQHDFDFEVGSWKIHLKRRLHPLTGSNTWVEFDGTSVTRKLWDGRSQIEQFETDSPTAGHVEGLTLRLYNPPSHQWRLYWASSKAGTMAGPPQIGEFKDGRGEFYCWDTYGDRTIFIRYLWSNITANSAHFEQSFSDDGGKTWEVNWITDQTRVSDAADNAPAPQNSEAAAKTSAQLTAAERDGQHGFDPLIGNWKYHLKRRLHPLTGSTTWVDLEGTGACYKVWDGRAQLDTIEVDGSTGHIEGLTLRLYNPQSHQWSLYWANSKIGILDPPQVGEFKEGHGDFYTQDTINGKVILIRYDWTNLTTSTPHFEQAFSDDGGKNWEVNWITDQTRMKE